MRGLTALNISWDFVLLAECILQDWLNLMKL